MTVTTPIVTSKNELSSRIAEADLTPADVMRVTAGRRTEALDELEMADQVEILTPENAPPALYSSAGQGYPEPSPYDAVLFDRRMRFVGDRVALVAAESLEAARQRLLEIMEEARNTEDLLQAEQQLTQREAEIESIKGRMQYLEQSARLSSIWIELQPHILSQPVGDEEGGPALQENLQRLLDLPLGLGIERARRLIEDEDARVVAV